MSDRRIVQALDYFSTSVNHVPVNVARGDLFFDDDPVVKKCPGNFADVQVRSHSGDRAREAVSKSTTSVAATETASAVPGQKRSVGRPSKTKTEETSEV